LAIAGYGTVSMIGFQIDVSNFVRVDEADAIARKRFRLSD
jgi:hypothetical protein